jgi:hypothetical protein
MISFAGDVDKFETLCHVCGHSSKVAGQFLPDVFLECGALLPPHLLDLCVRVAGQG